MPVFYCQNCGAKHTYSGKKPESCSKCRTKFEVLAKTPSFFSGSPSSPVKKAPPSVDPVIQRRLDLLAERRGKSKAVDLEDTDDEDFEYDNDDYVGIRRPRRLSVQIEVSNGSVGSIGEILKSENPSAFEDL